MSRAADAGPAALLRGKSTASSLLLFRVTCSDSCTHVKLIRHHFTLRCPYAAQLLPVTLVRLQLWQQNRVNDSQTSPTVMLQMCTSNPNDFLVKQADWAALINLGGKLKSNISGEKCSLMLLDFGALISLLS